jgi:hypothetical protein
MGSFVLVIFVDVLIPEEVQFLAPEWLAVFVNYFLVPGVVFFFTSWTIQSIVRVYKQRREINVRK